jgi:hypothetical protein
MNDTTRQSVLFKDLFTKPVVACFDQPDSSSDGGALFLKACDEPLGLTQSLARCLLDAPSICTRGLQTSMCQCTSSAPLKAVSRRASTRRCRRRCPVAG